LQRIYFKQDDSKDGIEDYTICKRPKKENGCKTSVIDCFASHSSHFWWSSKSDYLNTK